MKKLIEVLWSHPKECLFSVVIFWSCKINLQSIFSHQEKIGKILVDDLSNLFAV